MSKHFPIIIEHDEDGVYIVECPLVQGCRSYGYTIYEAMENIQDTIAVCRAEEELETLRGYVEVRESELAMA
jgi:predicted RNase H-like HicB family nuclease